MDTIPNGHDPEWIRSDGHDPKRTRCRMDTIANGHNPEWTQSRTNTIPNGHNPERALTFIQLLWCFIVIAWKDLFYNDEDLNKN